MVTSTRGAVLTGVSVLARDWFLTVFSAEMFSAFAVKTSCIVLTAARIVRKISTSINSY